MHRKLRRKARIYFFDVSVVWVQSSRESEGNEGAMGDGSEHQKQSLRGVNVFHDLVLSKKGSRDK